MKGMNSGTTYETAYAYIESLSGLGSVMGVGTVKELLRRLGDPQERLSVVHIAGTNGKGSIFAFVESILRQSGLKVGRYVSPTVFAYLERFQVDGSYMSEGEFARIMKGVIAACDAMVAEGFPRPTAFDTETAVAFMYFLQSKVDVVLLETGMGGATDSTNVVAKPICTVLAKIGMDHMAVLGPTLEDIFAQKLGIMRQGVPCVSYPLPKHLREMWHDKCQELEVPYIEVAEDELSIVNADMAATTFAYKGREYTIGALGLYQACNAAVAIEVANVLAQIYPIDSYAVSKGLANAVWQGRFQKISHVPLTFVDGAHNEDGWMALAENVRAYFPEKKIVYINGVFKDKEYAKMVDIMAPFAKCAVCIEPKGSRGLSGQQLAACYEKKGVEAFVADGLFQAKTLAENLAGADGVVLAFGSLSFLGELIKLYV